MTDHRRVGHCPDIAMGSILRPLRVCLVVALLSACGVDVPPADAALGDAPLADAALADLPLADAATPDAPVVADAYDVITASDAGGDVSVSCAAAPSLSEARNAVPRSGAFALRGVIAVRTSAATGCYWRAGYAVLARFTSPTDARWRIGARGAGITYFSAHDGCRGDDPGERLRCTSERVAATSPLDAPGPEINITLRAGQTLSLVANCTSDTTACTADYFAEPIADRGCFESDTPCSPGLACVWRSEGRVSRGVCVEGHAPTLRDVRVYRVGAATGTALDEDGDAHEVFAELLDRDGAVTPHRGSPRLQGSTAVLDVERRFRWLLGSGYPMPDNAVRARLWLRDGAGLESARVEVPIEAPTVLREGAPCVAHTSDPFTRTTECARGTLCLGGGATARCLAQRAPTLTRAAAWHDPIERVLSIDLEAYDPDHDSDRAEVDFLDAEGRSLPGESFRPYSAWRNVLGREGTYTLDERNVPSATRRIRVRVGDNFGLWSDVVEVTPTPTVTVAPGEACDPASTARRRCESRVALCVPRVGAPEGRCEVHEVSCPRYWTPPRWTPPATAGTYTVEGDSPGSSTPEMSCLSSPNRVGAVYEFVVPRTGTYRFALEALRGGPAHALALRDFCGGPELSAELACQVTAPAPGSSRAELTRALREGERVMIVGMATGGLRYRLAVTVP